MSLITKAVLFAEKAHRGQVRKYTAGEPYFVHCAEVAHMVSKFSPSGVTGSAMIAAAYCHDILEDTRIQDWEIGSALNDTVMNYVQWITKDKKETRKETLDLYNHKLAGAPDEVKLIKLADIYSNLKTIAERDAAFAKQYFQEKAMQAQCLSEGNSKLYEKVSFMILSYLAKEDA